MKELDFTGSEDRGTQKTGGCQGPGKKKKWLFPAPPSLWERDVFYPNDTHVGTVNCKMINLCGSHQACNSQ